MTRLAMPPAGQHCMRPSALLTVALLLLLFAAPLQAWPGRVDHVHDGDSLHVVPEQGGPAVKIRLFGLDAPELGTDKWPEQPWAREARDHLQRLLPKGELVEVIALDEDKYGRTVAIIVTRPNGTIIQETMLQAGLAWAYLRYCSHCTLWQKMEQQARAAGLGLWADRAPVQPWRWKAVDGKIK